MTGCMSVPTQTMNDNAYKYNYIFIFSIFYIMNNISPNLKPIDEITYEFPQSKYEVVPTVPFRALRTGPSGSGKSVLLTNMVLDFYKGVFSRIYIWSPSIHVDSIWNPVKKYFKEGMKIDTDKEKCFFEEFIPEGLEKAIETQRKMTEYSRKHKFKRLYPILLILVDIADNPRIARYSRLLNRVYVRGRHNGISVITSVQKFNALNTLIRVNATFFYKVRKFKEIELLQDELSALPRRSKLQDSEEALYKVYEIATSEPHSFLYINLLEKDISKMFLNFKKYLQFED